MYSVDFKRACQDALTIYEGASNPLGVSKAYARACTACYKQSDSTDDSEEWAAARLIHAQLGHLHRTGFR